MLITRRVESPLRPRRPPSLPAPQPHHVRLLRVPRLPPPRHQRNRNSSRSFPRPPHSAAVLFFESTELSCWDVVSIPSVTEGICSVKLCLNPRLLAAKVNAGPWPSPSPWSC